MRIALFQLYIGSCSAFSTVEYKVHVPFDVAYPIGVEAEGDVQHLLHVLEYMKQGNPSLCDSTNGTGNFIAYRKYLQS
jgi:hypothetical protein